MGEPRPNTGTQAEEVKTLVADSKALGLQKGPEGPKRSCGVVKTPSDHANQFIRKYDDLIKQQYGFVVDETQPILKRVKWRIGEMNADAWCAEQRNMACHNLLQLITGVCF